MHHQDLPARLERLGDAFFRRAAAHVKEVGRLPTVQLDQVHRCHRQAGTIDHAGDITIEGHVVKVMCRGLAFLFVFLRDVTQLDELGLPVQRVAFDVDFRVERQHVASRRDDQRVYLDETRIAFDVQAVHALYQIAELAHLLLVEPEPESELSRLVVLQSGVRSNGHGKYLFRRFGGHLLDIHAAGGRGDERNTTDLAVDEHRQVPSST